MNIQSLKNKIGDNNLVYLIYSGSKLYGTDSETSDTDYKGIYIPTITNIITRKVEPFFSLGTGKKDTKNTKDDTDIELISIFNFIDLLKKGDTGGIDIAFSIFREDIILEQDQFFVETLKKYLPLMICKKSKSFIGYCLNQSSKYGLKGDKLKDIKALMDAILKFEHRINNSDYKGPSLVNMRFSEFTNSIEFNEIKENFPMFEIIQIDNSDYLTVLGKNLQLAAPFNKYSELIKKMVSSYGKRTELAMEAGGIDWKSLSHAVRTVDELNELLTTGFIKFPLTNAEYIKSVKYGHEKIEDVMAYLTEKIDLSKTLEYKSSLQETVPESVFDQFILEFYKTRSV